MFIFVMFWMVVMDDCFYFVWKFVRVVEKLFVCEGGVFVVNRGLVRSVRDKRDGMKKVGFMDYLSVVMRMICLLG